MRIVLMLLSLVALTPSAFAESPSPRTHGGLTVAEPPPTRSESLRGRIATDFEGTFVFGAPRTWVGPSVPGFVPIGIDSLELIRLSVDAAGYLAQYREMFSPGSGAEGCASAKMFDNCKQRARFYRADGTLAWELDLNALFSRTSHLSVNAMLHTDGVVYYNEACQTYAAEAKGQCSNVVAIDVSGPAPKLLWRSKPLVSNAPILKVGRWLVTGYGFTAERDALHVVDAQTGKVVSSTPLKKAPEALTLIGAGEVLEVLIYGQEEPVQFTLSGFDSAKKNARPKLRLVR